ncbi:g7809 [Coccomyxa viridis]|uniref:G7809 protein n=1 Tax=Coccomyxa viridis TaxID=1274662 RepID=A0ABP1FYT6_9CHLO
MAIEGILILRYDIDEDGSPYMDVQAFMRLLGFLGVMCETFTSLAASRMINHLCDDADQISDLQTRIDKLDERNDYDEESRLYGCNPEEELAMRSKCQCCEAGPWETADEMRAHFHDSAHISRETAEEQQRLQQEREEIGGCDICGNEGFRSQAAKASHQLTKSHLEAVERAERREQRRLGHRVQGRTHEARAPREAQPASLRMEDYTAVGTEGRDRPLLHMVGRARRGVPNESISDAPQSSGLTPEVAIPEAAETFATREDAASVIESAPGPSERGMIVAVTTARLVDRPRDGEGYSDDHPRDDFVTYLRSRFSDPQKRMFAESYGVYMRKDMRNSFCIDLDEAFEWLGYRRKDAAVRLLTKIGLVKGQEFQKSSRNGPPPSGGPGESFDIAVKYRLTPRAFKKLLMRARTEQGDAASDYFLDIEEALLAYNTLRRTSGAVSQFDSTARARRNGLGLRSVTDSIDTHRQGVYFGVPERTWAMLKPLNPTYSPSLLTVDRSEMTVIKFGMKRGDTDRVGDHTKAFKGFYLLDHVPTEYMAEVEDLLKVWLRNEGLLFEATHEHKNGRDTELIVVTTQADYTRVVERTQLLVSRQRIRSVECSALERSLGRRTRRRDRRRPRPSR